MSKWLLALGLLAGCATTNKVAEFKYAPGVCLERAANDEKGSTEVVQVIGQNATQYILLLGALETPNGVVVVTERAEADEVNSYKKAACEDNGGAI